MNVELYHGLCQCVHLSSSLPSSVSLHYRCWHHYHQHHNHHHHHHCHHHHHHHNHHNIIVILIILSFHYECQYSWDSGIDYHYYNCSGIRRQMIISMGLGSICPSLGPIDHHYWYHILIFIVIIMLTLLSLSLWINELSLVKVKYWAA